MHRQTYVAAALALLTTYALAPGTAALRVEPHQPGPTATGGPSPTAGPSPTLLLPPPDIAGTWSVSRTWYRSCPGCAFPVSRTATWRISQFGINVSVDSGPRGVIVGAPDGSGYLTLDGVESSGPDVFRFLYATLRVQPDGAYFEGGFNGSESILNPCGSTPPQVSCSASNGWLTARRVAPPPASATPPGPPPPTDLPTPFPLPSATATPPVTATPTASATPVPSDTPLPTPTPTPTVTPQPLWHAWLPALILDWPTGNP